MSVISKVRAVRSAENRKFGFFKEEEIFNSSRLTPSRLIEIDNQLKDELNRLLSTRPHFQRTVSAGAGSQPR
jgi:hypothetical protein